MQIEIKLPIGPIDRASFDTINLTVNPSDSIQSVKLKIKGSRGISQPIGSNYILRCHGTSRRRIVIALQYEGWVDLTFESQYISLHSEFFGQ